MSSILDIFNEFQVIVYIAPIIPTPFLMHGNIEQVKISPWKCFIVG